MISRGHLRVVSDRFDGTLVDGKSCISVSDAVCIDILVDYFSHQENFELAGLLNSWKKDSDSRFVERLKRFTLHDELEPPFPTDIPDDGFEDFSPTYIEFGNVIFNVSKLILVKKGFGYSEERSRSVFYLEVNSKDKIYSSLSNIRVEYNTEELRDSKYEELKQKLISFGIKFI